MLDAPPLSEPAVASSPSPHDTTEIHIIPLKMIRSTHLSYLLLKTKKSLFEMRGCAGLELCIDLLHFNLEI